MSQVGLYWYFINASLSFFSPFSPDRIWKTDLDWLIPHQDRLVILRFLTGDAVNATATTTQAPYHHPAAQVGRPSAWQ